MSLRSSLGFNMMLIFRPNSPKGSVYYDATEKVGGNTGGTVVVHVNQGDEVFIRTTNTNYNLVDILSDNAGRTYFGGWLFS